MLANLSLERLRFFPTPDEVFTLRATRSNRAAVLNGTRKALWPPLRMNSARGAWHKKGVRPEGATRKEEQGRREHRRLANRGSAGSGSRPEG